MGVCLYFDLPFGVWVFMRFGVWFGRRVLEEIHRVEERQAVLQLLLWRGGQERARERAHPGRDRQRKEP